MIYLSIKFAIRILCITSDIILSSGVGFRPRFCKMKEELSLSGLSNTLSEFFNGWLFLSALLPLLKLTMLPFSLNTLIASVPEDGVSGTGFPQFRQTYRQGIPNDPQPSCNVQKLLITRKL